MAKESDNLNNQNRDGTSQLARNQARLSPDYVAVDERKLEDFLRFAYAYAGELNYFNDENQLKGDWKAFIDGGTDLNEEGVYDEYLEQAAMFAGNPEKFTTGYIDRFCRPHFALYLSFLRLLETVQGQLNGFTRRHLEFYYDDLLHLTKKSAIPDKVNILLRPAPRNIEVEVPAGHLLEAGRDSNGKDRFYRTDRRIVVDHAKIARLSSAYAERQVTGIKEARENYKGTDKEAFLYMLSVALGDPLPGDPMPAFAKDRNFDHDLLLELKDRAGFCRASLYLEFFELRDLMKFKRQRDNSDEEWSRINHYLEMAGKKRTGNAAYVLAPDDPRDFHANFVKAMEGEPDYAGLTQVESVDDVYYQRTRSEVKDFIRNQLYFENVDDFVAMMQIKVKIDNEWKEINRILELAGHRKRESSAYTLIPVDGTAFDPADFNGNFDAALNYDKNKLVDFASVGAKNIDEYFVALEYLESYFYTSLENFSYLADIATRAKEHVLHSEWDKLYSILAESHSAKVYARRRNSLMEINKEAGDGVAGFRAMLYYVLGEEPVQEPESPLPRVKTYVNPQTDYAILEDAEKSINAGQSVDLTQICRILEMAQRYRERLPEPVAKIQRWINLHPYADATTVLSSTSIERWKTFGEASAVTEETPPEVMGWAISSPMLLLSAGYRKLILTLGFDTKFYDEKEISALFPKDPIKPGQDAGPFNIYISTGKAWVQAQVSEVRHGDYYPLSAVPNDGKQVPLSGLQFILEFAEEFDPIVAPVPESTMASDWPVVKFMLKQQWDDINKVYTTQYAAFEYLQLLKAHLHVQVGRDDTDTPSGLADVLIQNDQQQLDASKPFHPFGTSPSVGSRFYLVHQELNYKRLDKISFVVDWMGAPSDFKTHYANYADSNAKWEFKSRISLMDKRVEYEIDADALLFDSADASKLYSIKIGDIPASLTAAKPTYKYRRNLDQPAGSNVQLWTRYLLWELSPLDFQHQAYQSVSTKMSAQMAAFLAGKDTTYKSVDGYLVNPPYTPKLKSLEIHYTASQEVDLKDYVPKQSVDKIFHIHPFGYNEAHKNDQGGYWFMPKYESEGELYIGVEDSSPPRHLSVLFQMAEGSANPDKTPVPVKWSYLDGDRWLDMAVGAIHLDTTRGLINSGIIEFELRPVAASTRLPEGYYWLRASIPYNSDSVCDTIAIHAQAVSATLHDGPYATDHYQQPLPANTITKLRPPITGIAELMQPYTSFGGKPQEKDKLFYTRASERLRHKQRALTTWDYEHLVLEHFPLIYKVKCLPADAFSDSEHAGGLHVVVIPDIRNRLPFDPFEPKAPANMIADIKAFLTGVAPAYADINVHNAYFVQVKVRIGVRFTEGYDVGFYKARLVEDLNRFLSPWAYQDGADIVIGGKIYANSIINYLEQCDYVDYVAAIKLFSSEDGRNFSLVLPNEEEGYFVATARPDGVLVAAREHDIDVISDAGYEEKQFIGINYMKVELDFIVG